MPKIKDMVLPQESVREGNIENVWKMTFGKLGQNLPKDARVYKSTRRKIHGPKEDFQSEPDPQTGMVRQIEVDGRGGHVTAPRRIRVLNHFTMYINDKLHSFVFGQNAMPYWDRAKSEYRPILQQEKLWIGNNRAMPGLTRVPSESTEAKMKIMFLDLHPQCKNSPCWLPKEEQEKLFGAVFRAGAGHHRYGVNYEIDGEQINELANIQRYMETERVKNSILTMRPQQLEEAMKKLDLSLPNNYPNLISGMQFVLMRRAETHPQQVAEVTFHHATEIRGLIKEALEKKILAIREDQFGWMDSPATDAEFIPIEWAYFGKIDGDPVEWLLNDYYERGRNEFITELRREIALAPYVAGESSVKLVTQPTREKLEWAIKNKVIRQVNPTQSFQWPDDTIICRWQSGTKPWHALLACVHEKGETWILHQIQDEVKRMGKKKQ